MLHRAGIAAFLLALTCPAPAPAAELTVEQAAILYQIALRLSPQYEQPNVAPEIHLVERNALKQRACRRESRGCDTCMVEVATDQTCMEHTSAQMLHGLTDWRVIYMAADLDFADTVKASILLHEMVHYIQQWNLGVIIGCERKYALELEARFAQIQALREQRGEFEQTIQSLLRGMGSYRCTAAERQG